MVPLRQPGVVEALDAALAQLPAPYRFRYSMIRGGLSACLVYLSYSGVLVRPLIPPTSENLLFTDGTSAAVPIGHAGGRR